MTFYSKIGLILSLLTSTTLCVAEVTLPHIFGDGMVLQRRQNIPVWGWANAGEQVSVTVGSQNQSTTADASGNWRVVFNPLEASAEAVIFRVKGSNTLNLSNVLIGEVWICSGQSNMEWTVAQSKDAELEIRNGNDPLIRHFFVSHHMSATPLKDLPDGRWAMCNPATVGQFTAVGYFFARQLRQELGVPIGLINTSWGGTISETWTSKAALEQHPAFAGVVPQIPADLAAETKRINEKYAPKLAEMIANLPKSAEIQQLRERLYNYNAWNNIQVPGFWKGEELSSLDGAVWFRRNIVIGLDVRTDQPATLSLSSIDDADSTFINGVLVGTTDSYSAKRVYTIPAGVLQPGYNSIAVRVLDGWGGGGFTGHPDEMTLKYNDITLNLAGTWKYRIESILRFGANLSPNDYPTLLYNAMLHPLMPYAIQGAIWYQGESNAGRAIQYRQALPMMIEDWRKHWGQGDFPFLLVQLANFRADDGNSTNGGSTWAELRESQAQTLRLPKTGMAVTVDIGERDDIHPRNKQDVGKRLAAQAMQVAYNSTGPANGPTFRTMTISGEQAVLDFDFTAGGLVAKDGPLGAFEIAAADQRFYKAEATISGNTIVVKSQAVTQPVAVRYAWADDPVGANLYNDKGFPAVPFRTDNWTGKTERSMYKIEEK
jgi:sialate O-acetylesterase